MMENNICKGQVGLSNLKDGYVVNEVQKRINDAQEKINNLEKCIDVIEQLEEKQDNINEIVLKRLDENRDNIKWLDNFFLKFVGLSQCKGEVRDNKIKRLEEKCKQYKRNALIGFIGYGIVDIILCITILLQM